MEGSNFGFNFASADHLYRGEWELWKALGYRSNCFHASSAWRGQAARQPWLAQPCSVSGNPRVMNSCSDPLAILCWTPRIKGLVSPSSQWLAGPLPPCRSAIKQQCQHSSRTSIYWKEL